MKCKQCETALTGRQREFCSDKCRKQASRTKTGPEDGSESTNADRMVVLNADTNRTRTPIPGDPDYVGCCKQVDGEWHTPKGLAILASLDAQLGQET